MINEKIGNNIKRYRELRKLTQKQLADKLRISVKNIQRYEAGENSISIEILLGIGEELNVSIRDLMSGVEKIGKMGKRWRGRIGERYFYLNSENRIAYDSEYRYADDDARYKLGNYFKTEDESLGVQLEIENFWEKFRNGE